MSDNHKGREWPSGYDVGLDVTQDSLSRVGSDHTQNLPHCFLEQETLHCLLSTGLFQEADSRVIYI